MKTTSTLLFLLFSTCFFAQKIDLKKDIDAITKDKDAIVAVSVLGIDFPMEYQNKYGSKRMVMQSVFKFHIALTVMDWVDKGRLKLDKKIPIKKSDLLEDTWSPIREAYPAGTPDLTLGQIIDYTVAQSDNNGCDILLRMIGGPKSVQEFMNSKKVKNFQIKYNEEQMQQGWRRQYENYTTAESASKLLKEFYDAKILTKPSTDFLMNVMLGTTTGTNKLIEQLPKGTPVAHKTGSSSTNSEGITAAHNDIGIVTLPNGRHYAISVFVNDSKESEEDMCKIISDVSKVVWDSLVN